MQKYQGLPLHRDTGPTLQCFIVTWFYIYYSPCIDNVSAMPLNEYYRITCINPLHVKVIFQHYNGQLHRSWQNDLGVHRIMKISYILINILILNKTTNSLVNIFYLNKKNCKLTQEQHDKELKFMSFLWQFAIFNHNNTVKLPRHCSNYSKLIML